MSEFTILKRYEFAHLAHLDRAKLADEEIESFLQDDNIVSINPVLTNAVGGVKLLAPRFVPNAVLCADRIMDQQVSMFLLRSSMESIVIGSHSSTMLARKVRIKII